jgi:DNA primase
MNEPITFLPDGNDLRKILFYYGIDLDDKIICPFHDDHHPSCTVDFESGAFHCFACGVHGDAFKFVQLANPKISNLSQLILYFAILNSSKVKKLSLEKIQVSKKSNTRDKVMEMDLAYDYYFGLKSIDWKKESNEYKEYMINRGFTSETLNMIKAKLTFTSNNYPLIFPIFDLDQFKGYVCRTTDKRVEKQRKYLYNTGFSRIDTLGGTYNSDVVVLCEGFMDMLKLRQYGLTYVAAIFGWKITSKQIEKLRSQGVRTIISALDMDKPGRKGTDYLRNFFDVVEFQFPKGIKDPGELSKNQFKVAYNKTKKLLRSRRIKNVNS